MRNQMTSGGAAAAHGRAHPIDLHVGRRLRKRRWLLGLSLEFIAGRVGLKAQQIQKYETGVNRVSASRLWELARVLDVPTGYFFDGLETPVTGGGATPGDPLNDKEAATLVRAYYALPEHQRRRLLDLARALAEAA